MDYTGKYKDTGVEFSKDMYENAGLDIRSSEEVMIRPHTSEIIHTNLYVAIPKGCVGLLWSRSGLSCKNEIETGAGCIDSNYRGEIKVHLYNHSNKEYLIEKGDKITQMLTIPVVLEPYTKVNELDDSDRGDKGFGSSGK